MGLPQKVGADLIGSQTARAAWLVRSMLGTFEDSRLVPLGATVQRVADSFEAHRRLISLQLECSVTRRRCGVAIAGGLGNRRNQRVPFLPHCRALTDVAKPRIELHADIRPPAD